MEALERFARLVAEPAPRLDEALALIASCDREGVDTDALMARLDDIAVEVDGRLDGAVREATLCAELFGPVGFRGDTTHYHDPRNSLLDQVLDRRRGIPITLSILAIGVGRRLGVELVGVAMPGHFVVRSGHDDAAFFDPFHGGVALGIDDCAALMASVVGPAISFDPALLAPSPPTLTVTRVLNNLRAARLRQGDRAGLITALRLARVVPGSGPETALELAGALASDGRFDEAARLHDDLAAEQPGRRVDHHRAALGLRARMN